jgi:hypothetical protein
VLVPDLVVGEIDDLHPVGMIVIAGHDLGSSSSFADYTRIFSAVNERGRAGQEVDEASTMQYRRRSPRG